VLSSKRMIKINLRKIFLGHLYWFHLKMNLNVWLRLMKLKKLV